MKRVNQTMNSPTSGGHNGIRTVTLATTILMEFNESFYYCCRSSNNVLQTNNFNFQLRESMADNENEKFSNDGIHRFCMDFSLLLSRFILLEINRFFAFHSLLAWINHDNSHINIKVPLTREKKMKIEKSDKSVSSRKTCPIHAKLKKIDTWHYFIF